ncbi:MAG TPA: D-alanyl-D-alanine carboxypeptidase/D-alanyl-D-alanine-endopeptidase, partial [Thermoleophilia bacterium]
RQYSARLGAVIRHMDKESDNFFAEMLVKGLGKDIYGKGSTTAGVKALQATLRASGMTPAQYRVRDGCGLSYGDRLTAAGIVSLLGDMWLRPDFRPYYDSLAIAGVDGTLEERLRGTAAAGNARAKSGTLNIAVCLSGYVESANGHRVAFSILVNGGSVSWAEASGAQDAIVVTLAKASLAGSRQSPFALWLRHFPVSALETVHAVGGVF